MLRMMIDLTYNQCVELVDFQAEILRMCEIGKKGMMLAQVYPLQKALSVAVVEHDVAVQIIDLVWGPIL